MATTTTKLALTKPDLTDARDVRVLNTNFDIIDKALTGNANGQLAVTVTGTPTLTNVSNSSALSVAGNDSRGLITFTTSGAGSFTFTYATAFGTAPASVVTAPGASNTVGVTYITAVGTTTFTVNVTGAVTTGKLYYVVVA